MFLPCLLIFLFCYKHLFLRVEVPCYGDQNYYHTEEGDSRSFKLIAPVVKLLVYPLLKLVLMKHVLGANQMEIEDGEYV